MPVNNKPINEYRFDHLTKDGMEYRGIEIKTVRIGAEPFYRVPRLEELRQVGLAEKADFINKYQAADAIDDCWFLRNERT